MSNETMTLKVIAHIHTAFPTKFGIPGRAGWWTACGARSSSPRNTATPMPCADWRISATSGWCGNSPARCGRAGLPPSGPRAWAATPGWACLPPAPLSAQSAGPFQRQAGGHRAPPRSGPGAHRAGRRPDGRHPIYDIKPYIPYADCHPDAAAGFTAQTQTHKLQVECPPELWETVPAAERDGLRGVLENDPVPPTSTTRSGYTEWNFRDWKSILS